MSNIKIQMTFQTVTPESAEHGDFADHGFASTGGWLYSIADDSFQDRAARDGREQALEDMTPAPLEFESVDEAIEFLGNYGGFEPSSSVIDESTWLTQLSAIQDRAFFEDGEETTLSFHIEGDPAAVIEVLRGAVA